jgi:hypothetical protein
MSDAPVSLVDGIAEERIAVTDRGLHYGDGLVRNHGVSRRRTAMVRATLGAAGQVANGCDRAAGSRRCCARKSDSCAATQRCIVKLIYTGAVQTPAATGHPVSGARLRILTRYPWVEDAGHSIPCLHIDRASGRQ